MLILKDEHAIDVLNSGNIRHLWHDFHAIDVHATDVGDPEDEDEDGEVNDEEGDNQVRLPRRQPRQSQLRRLACVSSGIVRLSTILISDITIIIVTLGIVIKMWKMRGTIFAASGGNASCGGQSC